MIISVIIPTFRRPNDLSRCLASLSALTRQPDKIIIVRRRDDGDTEEMLAAVQQANLRVVTVHKPGAVAAYNRGLEEAIGSDIVSIIDDDAAPHSDWMTRIETAFAAEPGLGGLGGRDRLHEKGTVLSAKPGVTVGMIQWFGRMIGNHHLGVGEARPVSILKGVNMSWRGTAISGINFDPRLRGLGAQVHLEVGFCTAVSRRGWNIVYDPAIQVDHYLGARFDNDRRGTFSFAAQFDKSHNEQLSILEALPSLNRIAFLFWGFSLGSRDVPGPLHLPRLLMLGIKSPVSRVAASILGRFYGCVTWRRTFG